MYIPIEELNKATERTREGKLMEATRIIQRALGGMETPGPSAGSASLRPHARVCPADVVDVEFREVPARTLRPPETLPAPRARPSGRLPQPAPGEAGPGEQGATRPATFEAHRFLSGGRTYTYRLYVPPRSDARLLPVIVMLHGCTQDAIDFAAGTAMNELAAQRGCIIVYPEQLARANSMRCWNWFEPSHQQRGRGEPAMIAALATHVVQRCNGDPQRVYVAGLSAGGAMAALVGQLYPDVFAALGVHSGLPAAAATDVQSAHAAMRKAARKPTASTGSSAAVPTIVFHGRADRTVHPGNGRKVIEEAAARAQAAGVALQREEQQMMVAGRTVTRTVYTDAQQVTRLEHWDIAAGTHAWSGGNASGSHTDPSGPSASAAMIEFFLAQQLARDDAPIGWPGGGAGAVH
jgi:poly(hydroxyalkanoate) depolymerase family esterase